MSLHAPTPRTVLVTGGARGIGLGIARSFLAAGDNVALVDADEGALQQAVGSLDAPGSRLLPMHGDLRAVERFPAWIDAVMDRFGGLDILVNNARPRLLQAPFEQTLDEWDLAMDVLLKAPAFLFRAALPALRASQRGCVVNISSTNDTFVSQQPAAYHAAKAGLAQLTRYLAYTFGRDGLRVNGVCPGLVDLFDPGRMPLTSQRLHREATARVTPLGRAATAEDVADAVRFLCSPAAAYINGQMLVVDGGMTLGDPFQIAREALIHPFSPEVTP